MEHTTNAYAQWATFSFNPHGGLDISIQNAEHSWGKFYYPIDDKGKEIPPETVNTYVIYSEDSFSFGACGRSDASSGTTGSFQLWDKSKNVHIGTYSWSCPWGSKSNESIYTVNNANYIVVIEGVNLSAGALGSITFSITYVKSNE